MSAETSPAQTNTAPPPEPIEIKLSSIEVPIPPLSNAATLSNIKTKKNIKNRKNSVPLSDEELIKIAKALDRLHEIDASDTAFELKQADDIRKIEIEKTNVERAALEKVLRTTKLGPICLQIGPTFFLDIHSKLVTPGSRDKLCESPDDFIVYFVAAVLDLVGTKLHQTATYASSLAIKSAAPLVKQNNIVGKLNKATNSGSRGLITTFKTVLTNGFKVLILPLKAALAPVVPIFKLTCSELQFADTLYVLLKIVDKFYIEVCLLKTWNEIGLYLTTTMRNNAIRAAQTIKEGIIKSKQLSHNAYDLAKATFTEEHALQAGEELKSGFLAAKQYLGSAAKDTFTKEHAIEAAQGLKAGVVGTGQLLGYTAKGVGTGLLETGKFVGSVAKDTLTKEHAIQAAQGLKSGVVTTGKILGYTAKGIGKGVVGTGKLLGSVAKDALTKEHAIEAAQGLKAGVVGTGQLLGYAAQGIGSELVEGGKVLGSAAKDTFTKEHAVQAAQGLQAGVVGTGHLLGSAAQGIGTGVVESGKLLGSAATTTGQFLGSKARNLGSAIKNSASRTFTRKQNVAAPSPAPAPVPEKPRGFFSKLFGRGGTRRRRRRRGRKTRRYGTHRT